MRSFDAWGLAIWTFRDQKAQLVERHTGEQTVHSLKRRRRVVGNVHGFEQISQLGCLVDVGGQDPGRLHDAAEAVLDFVSAIPASSAALLVRSASLAEMPGWVPDVDNRMLPVWRRRPAYGPDGSAWPKAVTVHAHPVTGKPFYCPVEPAHPPRLVSRLREVYTEWWQAVRAVEDYFRSRPQKLPGVILLPFAIPEAPWER